jgi:hypothetical protein
MGGDNTRLFFALLIGLSIGFLAGFLVSSEIAPARQAVAVTGGAGAEGRTFKLAVLPFENLTGDPEQEFLSVVERTNEAHAVLAQEIGPAADYVLTNAHRRRALLKLNVRELYHISRLREDGTAQWEIRKAASEMSRLAKKAMPLACLMLGGKDAYPGIYAKVFGRPPKMFPPKIFQ